MPRPKKKYRIFISAAEPSADSHCAALIAALRESSDDIDFVGVGGPKMASAGCDLLETTVGRASMMYKAFTHVVHYYRLLKRIRAYLESHDVDLVIVCDSPSFNFHVAKAASQTGIRTMFYVAPQLWAWAGWRIHKLRKSCDKLCCILPFEKDWFGDRAIDAVFVGNPLLDDLPENLEPYKKGYTDFDPANVSISLMPGSRAAELKSLWRPMQQIALRIKSKYPGVSFLTVAVDDQRQHVLRKAEVEGFECRYAVGTVSDAARKSDFAVVTSGSATLEVAAAGCPMVIMYQSSRILWHLVGRWLLKTKYLSLVNILAGREMVPEFMPYFSSIEPIAETIESFLEDKAKLATASGELIDLVQPLNAGRTAQKVAAIVREMLD